MFFCFAGLLWNMWKVLYGTRRESVNWPASLLVMINPMHESWIMTHDWPLFRICFLTIFFRNFQTKWPFRVCHQVEGNVRQPAWPIRTAAQCRVSSMPFMSWQFGASPSTKENTSAKHLPNTLNSWEYETNNFCLWKVIYFSWVSGVPRPSALPVTSSPATCPSKKAKPLAAAATVARHHCWEAKS